MGYFEVDEKVLKKLEQYTSKKRIEVVDIRAGTKVEGTVFERRCIIQDYIMRKKDGGILILSVFFLKDKPDEPYLFEDFYPNE